MEKYFKSLSFLLIFFLTITNDIGGQCTLTATSSGGNASYTQIYVLVDASGDIVAENSTGTFTGVVAGTYQIHALNYNPANAPSPLLSGLIGMPVADVGSTTAGCFNSDFLTDFVVRVCSSCVQSNDVCENNPIMVTSSGGNASYTQVYVLADDSGDFISQNTTGTFTTTSLPTGETYHVYALNYNPANPPSPLPSTMTAGDALSTIDGGCFNSDFLTDYVCFSIISCTCTPTIVCRGTDISGTSSGGNASYTQVYVLADDSGNFITQNNTGTFSTTDYAVGDIYHLYALNYNPSNPPSPLPSSMMAGDALSSIMGGCFNADFLTDFICFEIDCCPSGSGFIR